MTAERSTFKNNPVITLKENENDQYGFTFGIKKAKLILEHIEDIQDFVDETQTKAD